MHDGPHDGDDEARDMLALAHGEPSLAHDKLALGDESSVVLA